MSDEPDLQSTWLQQTLPKVRQFEQRQHVRFEATRPVELHKATGIRVPCTLIDVSQTGCQLIFETSILIEVGRIYCIKLEGQEMLSASAVWRRERLAGFRFMTKLPQRSSSTLQVICRNRQGCLSCSTPSWRCRAAVSTARIKVPNASQTDLFEVAQAAPILTSTATEILCRNL